MRVLPAVYTLCFDFSFWDTYALEPLCLTFATEKKSDKNTTNGNKRMRVNKTYFDKRQCHSAGPESAMRRCTRTSLTNCHRNIRNRCRMFQPPRRRGRRSLTGHKPCCRLAIDSTPDSLAHKHTHILVCKRTKCIY